MDQICEYISLNPLIDLIFITVDPIQPQCSNQSMHPVQSTSSYQCTDQICMLICLNQLINLIFVLIDPNNQKDQTADCTSTSSNQPMDQDWTEQQALDAMRKVLKAPDANWTNSVQRDSIMAILNTTTDILTIATTGSGKSMLAIIPINTGSQLHHSPYSPTQITHHRLQTQVE